MLFLRLLDSDRDMPSGLECEMLMIFGDLLALAVMIRLVCLSLGTK